MWLYTTGVSLHFVRTSSPGSAGSTSWGSSGSHETNEKELARKENGWFWRNVGGQYVQFTRQMPNIKMITIVAMNINTELTRIVWDPNKRTPSLWSGLVVIHGLGSLGGGTFLLFWSKATVILSHSVSKIKIGLVLYTKVDCLDSGDFGNKVNLGVVMVHFEISSKLISPWYLAWNVFSGHSTKDSVGVWKTRN